MHISPLFFHFNTNSFQLTSIVFCLKLPCNSGDVVGMVVTIHFKTITKCDKNVNKMGMNRNRPGVITMHLLLSGGFVGSRKDIQIHPGGCCNVCDVIGNVTTI